MKWNEGDHGRKFMCSPGRYVDGGGPIEAKLTFWGEWEPPSDVVREWSPSGSLPRFLHAPIWNKSGPLGRQNTDPWVFGDNFRYSNCKQQAQPGLQRLTPGSVIFFGSTKDGEFVLDTVFVVKDSCRYTPNSPLETDCAFRFCTIEALCGPDSSCAGDSFALYRGATFEEPINGMYSFVPCQRADSRTSRFARPSIELPGFINPAAVMAPSGSTRPISPNDACEQWDNVRNQVLDAQCLLGVWFQTPQLVER
jgi:hypothetical protein